MLHTLQTLHATLRYTLKKFNAVSAYSQTITRRYKPLQIDTYRYTPLQSHTVTDRCIPLHTVTYRYKPLDTVNTPLQTVTNRYI